MATDNSPPRVRAIAITALTAVVILVGLKFVFDSYYVSMFEEEEYRKVGSVQSQQLIDLRAAEKRNLTSGTMPIDKAMGLLSRSRDEANAGLPDGGIVPEQSTDTGALIGWGKLPHELTPAELNAGAAADGGAPEALGADGGLVAGDGGLVAGDAGAVPDLATGGDAGALTAGDAGPHMAPAPGALGHDAGAALPH